MTGPMWHGPALAELLNGVSAAQASGRPLPDAHTIWELVLHIIVWCDIARQRLTEQALGDPTSEQDWPPVTGTWEAALERIAESHRALAAAARGLGDDQLTAEVTGLGYTVFDLLHGVIEHGTYHGGQIALLKKA